MTTWPLVPGQNDELTLIFIEPCLAAFGGRGSLMAAAQVVLRKAVFTCGYSPVEAAAIGMHAAAHVPADLSHAEWDSPGIHLGFTWDSPGLCGRVRKSGVRMGGTSSCCHPSPVRAVSVLTLSPR